MKNFKRHALWALPLVLVLVGVAFAARAVTDAYGLNESTGFYREDLTAADPINLEAVPLAPEIDPKGGATLEVSGRSDITGTTVVVHVARYNRTRQGVLSFHSETVRTLTASSGPNTDAAGDFPSNTIYIDTGGRARMKVIIELPSGGSEWNIKADPVGPTIGP